MARFSLINFVFKNKNKKAQAWSLDLIVASIIFLVAIIILYVYAINYTSQSQDKLEEMFYEGNLASGLILSEDDSGILSKGKVNQTKLEDFYNTDYQTKRSTLGLRHDFYFTFLGLEINGTPESYVGKVNSTNSDSLIQVTRLAVYKNNIIKFQIYIWE